MKCYGKCYSEGGVVLYFNVFIGSVIESVILEVLLVYFKQEVLWKVL